MKDLDEETKQDFIEILADMDVARSIAPRLDPITKSKILAEATAAGATAGKEAFSKINFLHALSGSIGRSTGNDGGHIGIAAASRSVEDYERDCNASVSECGRYGLVKGGAIGTAVCSTIAGAVLTGVAAVSSGPIGWVVTGAVVAATVVPGTVSGRYIGRSGGRAGGKRGFDRAFEEKHNMTVNDAEENKRKYDSLIRRYRDQFPRDIAKRRFPLSATKRISSEGGEIKCGGCKVYFPSNAIISRCRVKLLSIFGDGLWLPGFAGITRVLLVKTGGKLQKPARVELESFCFPDLILDQRLPVSIFRLSNKSHFWECLAEDRKLSRNRTITFDCKFFSVVVAMVKRKWCDLVGYPLKLKVYANNRNFKYCAFCNHRDTKRKTEREMEKGGFKEIIAVNQIRTDVADEIYATFEYNRKEAFSLGGRELSFVVKQISENICEPLTSQLSLSFVNPKSPEEEVQLTTEVKKNGIVKEVASVIHYLERTRVLEKRDAQPMEENSERNATTTYHIAANTYAAGNSRVSPSFYETGNTAVMANPADAAPLLRKSRRRDREKDSD